MDFYIDVKHEEMVSREMASRTPTEAYHWLLNDWARRAGLRAQDRLFIRFPLDFLPADPPGWNGARRQPLLAALTMRIRRFQVGLYLPTPSGLTPQQFAADLAMYARHAEAGVELDNSFMIQDGRIAMAVALSTWEESALVPRRQVRIEPAWDVGNPLTHTLDAVCTEDYLASGQNAATRWDKPKTLPPTLHVWFHRAYPEGTPGAQILDEMRHFVAEQGAAGNVPRLPLSLLVVLGAKASDFEPDTQAEKQLAAAYAPAALQAAWSPRPPKGPPLAHDGTGGVPSAFPPDAPVRATRPATASPGATGSVQADPGGGA